MRKIVGFLAFALFIAAVVMPKSKTEETDNTAASAETINIAETAAAAHEAVVVEDTGLIFNGEPHFVAHRGASDVAPENTVPAFEAAGESGFWGIETDISETSDGVFVCMHDESIDRTTTGEGNVGDYSLKQIMQFDVDVGSNIANYENLKIPKLTDYLEICADYGCVAVVEIKKVENYDKLIELLDESGCQIIITGGIEELKEIRRINKVYPLMVIGYAPKDAYDYIEEADALGTNCGLLLNHPMLDTDSASLIHGKGYYCGVWTINDNKLANKFFDEYGADYVVADSAACMKE